MGDPLLKRNKRIKHLEDKITSLENGPNPKGDAAKDAYILEIRKLREELAHIDKNNWHWLDPVNPAIPNYAGKYTPGFEDFWARGIGAEQAKENAATSMEGMDEFGQPTASQATTMGITPSPTQSGTNTPAPTTAKVENNVQVTPAVAAADTASSLAATQAKIAASPTPEKITATQTSKDVAQTTTVGPPRASATSTTTITQSSGAIPLVSTTKVAASFAISVPELPPAPNILDTPFTLINAGGMSLPLFFKDPSVNMFSFETPSALLVLKKSSSAVMYQTNKFLLQTITKPQQEKFQVIETFGRPHVFFYGERTRMYNIQGVLLDGFKGGSPDDLASWDKAYKDRKKLANKNMWATAMQDFYDKHLRGTELKNAGNIAALYVNGWLIKGYPVGLTIMKDANTMPDTVTFQMSWVIEKEVLLRAPDVEYQYQKFDQSAPLVKEMNKLAELQTKYTDARDEYIKNYSDGGGTDIERKQSNEKYKNAGGAVTAQQKVLNDRINADKGKARKLLNMD